MKCFYHNDLDGHCSAAIVNQYHKQCENDQFGEEYIEMSYAKPFPFKKIGKNERIIIVDFSLSSVEDWEKLLDITDNIIWIDHHISALEKYKHLNLKGLQYTKAAGCELVWEYYYPKKEVPLVVKLLGDYDTWTFKYGNDSKVLQLGIKLYTTYPENDNWNKWFKSDDLIKRLISEGKLIMKFRTQQYIGIVKHQAYFIEFEGHKAVVCNSHERRSQLFESIEKNYDIMMPFCFDGKKWTVSLYTTKNIDVSKIAIKYGGGGHKKAAGFVCDKLPF